MNEKRLGNAPDVGCVSGGAVTTSRTMVSVVGMFKDANSIPGSNGSMPPSGSGQLAGWADSSCGMAVGAGPATGAVEITAVGTVTAGTWAADT